MDLLKKILGAIVVLTVILLLVPIEVFVSILFVYGLAFVFARFFWPKIFFRKAGATLSDAGTKNRETVFEELKVFPTIDSNSLFGTGYIFLDAGLYVLVGPRSCLREGEEETEVSTHPAAAAECSDYGAKWRLLTYDEGSALADKLIVAADKVNYSAELTGSKILSRIAGKKPRKTYWSKFRPILNGATAAEDRHGEETVFAYGVGFSLDESGLAQDFEKIISRVSPFDEKTLTVCTDLENVRAGSGFMDSVELEGLDRSMTDVLGSTKHK